MVSRRAVICAGVCGLTGACLASILWGMDEAMALGTNREGTEPSGNDGPGTGEAARRAPASDETARPAA